MLHDEKGSVVATAEEPAVHEYGNSSGSTVSIVYTLADDAPLPKTAHVIKATDAVDAEPLVFKVQIR